MNSRFMVLRIGVLSALLAAQVAADPVPQPKMSLAEGPSDTWSVEWTGMANRTYFIQSSPNLRDWAYAPMIRFGDGVQNCGINDGNGPRLFIRFKYIDAPAVDSLVKARNADFDGDGIPNAIEVENVSSDPFDAASVGPDTDADGMPDGWELAYGLNPNSPADTGGDPDGDGLANLQECLAHTKPNYFDTDGDQFSDGFELGCPGYDPLVANLNGDADGDGLSDLDEMIYGTSPLLADSDWDGIPDIDEIEQGSDPLDILRTPFSASAYFGNAITESSVRPMGDLGVGNCGHDDAYKVRFQVNDGLTTNILNEFTSNQEAWRLVIGDTINLTTIPDRMEVPTGGTYPPFYASRRLQLDGRRVYRFSLQHLGLAGIARDGTGAAPDFNHFWSVDSNDFLFLTNNPSDGVAVGFRAGRKSNAGVYPPGYDWTTRQNYLVPIVKRGYSTSYSGNDATGPRFRKLSHFGRPIPDRKPENEAESDEASEESFVDAFDLSLHHDTSFASIPLAASDLRLESSASVRETTWSSRSGLRPEEEITSPFGISWSSNLCSYIETVETLGSSTTRPITVNVVDEGGRGQRFGTSDMTTFFPWPSSLTDKKTYLNELKKSGNDLVLTKKFGNKLTYRPCESWFMYAADRLQSSPTVVRHRYWRLAEVDDRFGCKVVYDYGASPYSLIPLEISAVGRPNQKLTITRSTNGRRVTSIKDAENNVTEFNYIDRTATVPDTAMAYPYQELESVTFPGNAREHYTYDVMLDPEPEVIGTSVTRHFHANLKSIRRDGYAEKVFSYEFDRSRKWYDHSLGRISLSANISSLPADVQARAREYVHTINKVPQWDAVQRVQYGVPRTVSKIGWPALAIESAFSKTAGSQAVFGPVFSASSGTDVTDAGGSKYTYTFGGPHGEIIDNDSNQTGGTTRVSNQWLVYYSTMTLQYKDAEDNVLGAESFQFDPDSGLSLKQTFDFCGNETNWGFEETRPASQRITLENKPGFLSTWADPTQKTDALGRVENYEYGNHRMLSKLTDVHGTVTDYTVDAMGRRTTMTVTDKDGTRLVEEAYAYDHPDFSGFMTRKTRKAFSNLSGKTWEQDLVVEYVPDGYGRIWKEIVDPAGENLQTIHTYDLNNSRLTSTDPKTNPTTFEYDERARLKKVIYADTTFKTFGYDDNNAKVRETDENGNSSLIERDGLGRALKSARDLDGDGEISAGDIIIQYGYDDLGLPRKEIDPRGFAAVTFYDSLHRPQHVFRGVPEASADESLAALTALASASREVTHNELSYEVASNPGGGLLQPFKPTGTTRHDAVSMEHGQADVTLGDTATYDDVYRPLETTSEYAPGSFKSTTTSYGTVNLSGREPLISTLTDSLAKVVRITRDGLGREIEVIDGFGNPDPDLVLTTSNHYTSTGLLWRVTDPLGRHTETEYDRVGRPVKVFQPDPVTGLITANSPVTETEYDENGNVSAVIDPLRQRTDFDYNSRNRKWRIRQPFVTDASNPDAPVANVRPTTTVFFDDVGNETAVTDARGSTIRKFYDPANRVFKTRANPQTGSPSADVDAPGTHDITTTTVFDKGGLALSIEDGNGDITRNAYDGLARLIATACDPTDGNPAPLPATGLDPDTYRSSNPTCSLVSYHHDDSGNVIQVTDGERHRTAFTFDGFARKTRTLWDPGTAAAQVESAGFNALYQTKRIDGMGRVTLYAYDLRHRLEDVIYGPVGAATTSTHPDNRHFSYDKADRVLGVTFPNEPDSLRGTAASYDMLDRPTSETSAGVTHAYPEYDKAGNRKQTTYGRTGTTLVSTYDALNRLETCEERSDAATPSGRTTRYAYDLGGKVTRKTLPNGNVTTTGFDFLGRTLAIIERDSTTAVVSSFDYSQAVGSWPGSHDAVGNVLRCAETYSKAGMDNRVVTNRYDHCQRLETETITPASGTATGTGYGYDLANNRTSKTVGAAVTEYVFGNGSNGVNSNQLISYGPAGQPASHRFTYDANGNRKSRTTAAGTETHTWDFENRLTALAVPAGTYQYGYDPRGRRVLRDESAAGGAVTQLTFSGGTSVQEANTAGTVQVEMIRGSDWGGGVGGMLYTIRSGQRSYNAYNSRGDVVSTSDASGAATWQAAYEGFGTRTAEQGANAERQRANTKEEDPTGLLNEGQRYRDLEAGVFISRDPAGFVDGPNVYAYVAQNPWTRFDPEGLSALDTINSMGDDWFGYWRGVGKEAGSLVSGIAKAVWNYTPAVNAWQLGAGQKTGYQKQLEGGGAAYSGFVGAAENLGGEAQVSGRSMTESVLDAAANHVDAATKDPEKFGALSCSAVITLAAGADAGMALYSKASSLVTSTARTTQVTAEAVAAKSGVTSSSGGAGLVYNIDMAAAKGTPSAFARAQQGSGLYPGIDRFRDITLKRGTFIYGGTPGQSSFYTTGSAIRRAGDSASSIFQGLQVAPHPVFGYRTGMTAYEVLDDIPAAFSRTLANPQNGAGRLPQIVVPEWQNALKPIHTDPLSP